MSRAKTKNKLLDWFWGKPKTESQPVLPGLRDPKPRIFTLSPTQSFLPELARSILNGQLPRGDGQPPSAIELASITLFVPTRRAVRTLKDCFLKESGNRALCLPNIRAIADADEMQALIRAPAVDITGELGRLPKAVSSLERSLVLMEFVRAWYRRAGPQKMALDLSWEESPEASPAKALALANDLIELFDESQLEGIDLTKLAQIVPDNFASHWSSTLEFLNIITEEWPHYLATQQMVSSTVHLDMLLRAYAHALQENPPVNPVIIAGEIGGVASTANLMRVIATLPQGAVVLPGLDSHLDEASWRKVATEVKRVDYSFIGGHAEHSQFGHKQFLDSLSVARWEVEELPGTHLSNAQESREQIISEIMRPAETTEHWADIEDRLGTDALKQGLSDISTVVANNEHEEAELIALILRQEAETEEGRAALVTPDRKLGRRVAARLREWDLVVDDSGGHPITRTSAGSLSALILRATVTNFAPAELAALLKHPLVHLGWPKKKVLQTARALELIAFRSDRPANSLNGLKSAYKDYMKQMDAGEVRSHSKRRLHPDDIAQVYTLIETLNDVFRPFHSYMENVQKNDLKTFARLHKEVFDLLLKVEDQKEGDNSELWQTSEGLVLSKLFERLQEEASSNPFTLAEYESIYQGLVGEEVVRSPKTHTRIFIWAPMESRLQTVDVVVLGGLNEGSWPGLSEPDPWVSRPMREQMGMSVPERKIGRSAHDFAQMLATNRVFLTRSSKESGVPTVASRWWLRLETIARSAGLLEKLSETGQESLLPWARYRDLGRDMQPITRPAPAPPVEARPMRMSVSAIENWLANPYQIYAGRILKLESLEPLVSEASAALKGNVIHDMMQAFSNDYNSELPDNMAVILRRYLDEAMGEFEDQPEVIALWRPRIERYLQWFAQTEPERRAHVAKIFSEIDGKRIFNIDNRDFTLTARADRIDVLRDDRTHIYDYKTGVIPSRNKVKAFNKPQLVLEMLIAEAGGFEGIDPMQVAGLTFIGASGGNPPGQEIHMDPDIFDDLSSLAEEKLTELVKRYLDPQTAYPAVRRDSFKEAYRFDDYQHLSRVREWNIDLEA